MSGQKGEISVKIDWDFTLADNGDDGYILHIVGKSAMSVKIGWSFTLTDIRVIKNDVTHMITVNKDDIQLRYS